MDTCITSEVSLESMGKKALTTSTFKIPAELLEYFSDRISEFGGLRFYFRHLIIVYGRHLQDFDLAPFSDKWKKKYQDKRLDLKRRDFVPDPEYWEEFRHIAFSFGPSMCKLIVILIQLEKKRWIQAGKPKKFCEKEPNFHQLETCKRKTEEISQIIKKKYNKQERFTLLFRKIDFENFKLSRIGLIIRDSGAITKKEPDY